MDTIERLLQLLALLAARPWWTGPELAARLETTERTVRRDVTRLRNAGYPVDAVSGPYGGYRLGSGTRLPPLVFDDDEAVAIALSLRTAADGDGTGQGTAALRALAKLDQVLPASVREQLTALATVTVGLRSGAGPAAAPDTLVRVAVASERSERIRFSYRSGAGEETSRLVEPYRLVFTERAWYLVAYDLDRADWRTFRVDRITDLRETSARFRRPADPPDAALQVATGIAVAGWAIQARVRLYASMADLAGVVAPTDGQLVPEPDLGSPGDPGVSAVPGDDVGRDTVLLLIGGDEEWIARYLARLPCEFDVLEPESVRTAVGDLARRLLVRHGPV